MQDFVSSLSVEGSSVETDMHTLDQIDKDVRRTLPDMSFFQQQIQVSLDSHLSPLKSKEKYQASRLLFQKLRSHEIEFGSRQHKNTTTGTVVTENAEYSEGIDCHWEAIVRILFVYAKLNPGVGYVQGMNEILAPIYHVFATNTKKKEQVHAEADSFWVFFAVISEIKDLFLRSMDNDKSTGIQASMDLLMKTLSKNDPQTFQYLESLSIHPAYFSLRWLSTLLSREFNLPDLIRVWDSLFSDKTRFDFLVSMSCSMIMCIRDQLLSSDYSECIKLLQDYPCNDLQAILDKAYIIYDKSKQKEKLSLRISFPSMDYTKSSPLTPLVNAFSNFVKPLQQQKADPSNTRPETPTFKE